MREEPDPFDTVVAVRERNRRLPGLEGNEGVAVADAWSQRCTRSGRLILTVTVAVEQWRVSCAVRPARRPASRSAGGNSRFC